MFELSANELFDTIIIDVNSLKIYDIDDIVQKIWISNKIEQTWILWKEKTKIIKYLCYISENRDYNIGQYIRHKECECQLKMKICDDDDDIIKQCNKYEYNTYKKFNDLMIQKKIDTIEKYNKIKDEYKLVQYHNIN